MFLYNTDAGSLSEKGRYPLLIEQGFAATSGPIRFGEHLGKLSPGDTLVMYENGVGIVASGIVRHSWDRISHTPPKYYKPGDHDFPLEPSAAQEFPSEYRISVNWNLIFDIPITVDQIRGRIGYIPRGTIVRIEKWQNELDDLISKHAAAQRRQQLG